MEIKYLWVDEIHMNRMLGQTYDIEKIYYNLGLMGDYGKELEQAINIKLLLVDHNAEAVASVGKFICVVHFEKKNNTASMQLCDSQVGTKLFWMEISKQLYPENTTKFMNIYNEAVLSSLLEGNLFELSLVKKP